MRTLITGSNGFIGSFILNNYIYNKEISFRAVLRGSEQLPQTKDKIFEHTYQVSKYLYNRRKDE